MRETRRFQATDDAKRTAIASLIGVLGVFGEFAVNRAGRGYFGFREQVLHQAPVTRQTGAKTIDLLIVFIGLSIRQLDAEDSTNAFRRQPAHELCQVDDMAAVEQLS